MRGKGNYLMKQSDIDKLLKQKEKNPEIDEIKEDLRVLKFLLQDILDELEGRIKSSNLVEYRDVYVFNDWGVLDANYPLIMDFELVKGMTKLVECKLSFKIRNFSSPVTL